MKIRSDSTLAQLTEDQRTTLYEWIEEHSFDEAMILAAKPAPDGFGLTFHKTTLQRWFQQERKHRNLQEIAARAAAMDPSTDPFEAQSRELTQLIAAAKSEFAHAIYELAQAATDPENFDRLQRSLHQAEMVQIKRQELALARDRHTEAIRQFNFNASRAALDCNIELQKILKDRELDNEDAIWAANDILFGARRRRQNMEAAAASVPSPSPKHTETQCGGSATAQLSTDHSEPCPATAVTCPATAVTSTEPIPTNDEYLPPFASLPSLECSDQDPAPNTLQHTNGLSSAILPQYGI